jgi:DNA-binding NarL/FixJ family response regulator
MTSVEPDSRKLSTVGAPIRVVLVEDNDTFRETLLLVFGLRDEIEIVGNVASGDEAPALCVALQPDVVLMDYRMPGLNGADATRAVLAAAPATSVVCLTASVTKAEIADLLAAGAVACLTKDEDFDSIVAAIEAAARG